MSIDIGPGFYDAVDFDDKVRVTFEEQDGIWYPLFEKVG